MKKKKNKRKKAKNKKQNKYKLKKFLKDYAVIIPIFASALAFLLNAGIKYYQKSISTEFQMQYLTVNINSDNWVKNIHDEQHVSSYLDVLKVPTLNNEINKLLYEYPKKVKGYYVTYLIITQTEDVEALDVTINFKQYGKAKSLKEKNLSDLEIDKNTSNDISEKIDYPFNKNETLKIPISICKTYDEYHVYPSDCYYLQFEPISIEYKNKYLFSKRNIPIREYLEHNVIIDGEMITGKGGVVDIEDEKAWYLK